METACPPQASALKQRRGQIKFTHYSISQQVRVTREAISVTNPPDFSRRSSSFHIGGDMTGTKALDSKNKMPGSHATAFFL
jgi:hypothetical protein